MAFASQFTRRFTPRAESLSKRFATDRSFRLATLDDLKVYHQTYVGGQQKPQFAGYSHRAPLNYRDMDKQMIIDLSHEQGYRRGHIPGAVNLPVEKFDFTRHVDSFEGIHQEEVVEAFKQLGVNDSVSELILYDNSGLLACRLWFVLRYYGFKNVRVLQGGWRNYLKAGLPISEDAAEREPSSTLTLKPKRTRLLTKPSQFFVDLNNKSAQIIDARRPDACAEYCVPGAINLPCSTFMDDAKFLPVDSVLRSLARHNIDMTKKTIVYSENGLSSCVAMFGLKMVGLDKASVYDLGLDNYRKVFDDSLSDEQIESLSR